MKKIAFFLLCLFAVVRVSSAQGLSRELMRDVKQSINKGVLWLITQQKSGGAWSDDGMLALTALPLWAIAASGETSHTQAVNQSVAFLLAQQQPDGGIYLPMPGRQGGGLGNYNTSICVSALYATSRPDVMPAILKGRAYIAASQQVGDDLHTGGFGYDKDAGRRYSDLNNTHFSMDAMRRTQGVEDSRPTSETHADINWNAALAYVLRMQNTEGETAGGFAYNTVDPKAGTLTNSSGRIVLRAYGSMTYAGVLSMVHARLDKSDPRVRSAVEYSSRFWTVDENPGQGQQGLYFYFNIMARALSAANLEVLPKKGVSDAKIRWREEVLRKVISLQKTDGSWANENNRWWENNPVLATSYALLAIEFAAGITL